MEGVYYIICAEQYAIEGSLLFWKPKGGGYTSHLEDAGLFDEETAHNINKMGRDIALTRKEIGELEDVKIYTIVDCNLNILRELKKMKQSDKEVKED